MIELACVVAGFVLATLVERWHVYWHVSTQVRALHRRWKDRHLPPYPNNEPGYVGPGIVVTGPAAARYAEATGVRLQTAHGEQFIVLDEGRLQALVNEAWQRGDDKSVELYEAAIVGESWALNRVAWRLADWADEDRRNAVPEGDA